jgi:CD109 antigen
MSSYLLLTAALRKDLPTAISVAQYLLAKRNSFGGYGSTQDTVIGVEALASIATELAPADTDIAVNVKYGDKSKDLTLNKEKSLLLQKVELPKESRKVEVTGKGKGFGLAQVSYSYYENKLGQPSFDLKYKVVNKTDSSYGLEVCADYTEDGNSNMAIIDVNLPSGYTYDKRWQSNTRINREESKDGNTGVIFYFNEMGNGTECVNVGAQKAFTVDFLKPALIAVYDYYAPEKRAEKFYDLSS